MSATNKSETRNLILYFVIAFGFSWLFWIPAVLASRGYLGDSKLADFLVGPNNPAAWGPFVSAFLLTWFNDRGEGIITLLKRAVDYRFAKKWWIPLLLIFPLMSGAALLIAYLTGEKLPELFWVSAPALILFRFVTYLFTGGPLQEEFGWRGYALDRLQLRFNALLSSIILGFMWGLWHLPYSMIGTDSIYLYSIIPVIISDILISILMTWLYNNTNRSLLVALLFHAMFIISIDSLPALNTQMGALFYMVFLLGTVIAVVAFWGAKRMVREQAQ